MSTSHGVDDHVAKKLKLDIEQEHGQTSATISPGDDVPTANDSTEVVEALDNDDSEDNCCICLQAVVDRTVLPKCSHEFCFECILVWTEQSRRCPLCSQTLGEYLIHSIRSRYDYRKHFLVPLKSSSPRPAIQTTTALNLQRTRQQARRRRQDRHWGARQRENDEADKLERSIVRRRWIYEHDLYAKHVASNSFTKYRPYPTPAQFSASQDLISRTSTFIRRELQVWEGLDVEFLTTLIISLMKSIDIRSEAAVKLVAEFLDLDAPYMPGGRHVNAEHFAHEVYSYVRSPYKDLFVYDSVAQYDTPPNLQPPRNSERSQRWHSTSPSREEAETSSPGEHSARSQSRTSVRNNEQYQAGPSLQDRPQSNDIKDQFPKGSSGKSQETDNGESHRPGSDTPSKPFGTSRLNENAGPYTDRKQDSKGKGRAYTREIPEPSPDLPSVGPNHAGTGSHTGKSNLEAALQGRFQGNVKVLDSGPSRTSNTRVTRPPRVRTLQESVKAHLDSARLPPLPANSGAQPTVLCPGESQSPKSDLPSNSSPSLLTRLSDSFHTPNLRAAQNASTADFQAPYVSTRQLEGVPDTHVE